MAIKYTEKVIEHFKNPHNIGELENPDGQATEGSPACGDMLQLGFKLDDKNEKIVDIKFLSYGCASNIATGSIITDLALGKTLEEAKKITWKDAAETLGGLPPVKVHCSVLAVDTLKSAIQNYEEKNGLVKSCDINKDYILDKLKHIINPAHGRDIVTTKSLKYLTFVGGILTMELELDPASVMFKENIEEEIKEHLEHIKEIKEMNIKFYQLGTQDLL